MGDVYRLPNRPQVTDSAAIERNARAAAIKRLIQKRPGGFGQHIEYAAAELYRILADREAGFKTRLCEHVFGSGMRHPTKRLWGIVWNPEKRKPAAKQRQRATIYVRIAEGIAQLSGMPEAEILLRLFPNIEPDAAAIAQVPSDSLGEQRREETWQAWVRATETIIRDLDLRRALRVAMEFPTAYDEANSPFRLEFNQLIAGPDQGLEGKHRYTDRNAFAFAPWFFITGLAPKLFLGECPATTLRAVVETPLKENEQALPRVDLASWAQVWFRFWWAILPIGPNGDPRGCFLVSLATERCQAAFPAEKWTEYVGEPSSPARGLWTALLHPEFRYGVDAPLGIVRRKRHVYGLALSWQAGGQRDFTTGERDGPYSCFAEPDEATRHIIRALFGRDAAELPSDPFRILPSTPQWRDAILGAPDGSFADWVGPNPDAPRYAEPIPPEFEAFETEEAYEAASDAYQTAYEDWRDAECKYQLRFLSKTVGVDAASGYGPFLGNDGQFYPTIGQKLEQSLLSLPETDRPDIALRRQAAGLAKHAAELIARGMAERRTKLEALGRPSEPE